MGGVRKPVGVSRENSGRRCELVSVGTGVMGARSRGVRVRGSGLAG
jgi:hypothetical protein